MKIKVVTDSVSDIPEQLVDEFDIEVVPLRVNFGAVSYKDGVDITTEDFFKKLESSKKLPTTSQVNPGEFKDVFEKYLDSYDHIICITMSSEMSGTFKAANIAKEFLETDKITILDSKAISFGYGLIVLNTAKRVQEGMALEEILKKAAYDIEHLENIFVVDTLEYLKKGGRLSPGKAFMGKLLKVKPILTIEEGKLKAVDKVRGRKKAVQWVLEYIKKSTYDLSDTTIGFFHAVDKDYMNFLEQEVEKENEIGEIIYSEVGCVVGTHSGPGCIAMVFIK